MADFDHDLLPPDGTTIRQFMQKIDASVRRDLVGNFLNAWPFVALLLIWVAVASGICIVPIDGIQPTFVVNSLAGSTVTQTVAPISTWGHAVYYNAAMISSVGASDLVPFNRAARVVSLLDSFAGIVVIGLVVSLLSLAFDQRDADGNVAGPGGRLRRLVDNIKLLFQGNKRVPDNHAGKASPTQNSVSVLSALTGKMPHHLDAINALRNDLAAIDTAGLSAADAKLVRVVRNEAMIGGQLLINAINLANALAERERINATLSSTTRDQSDHTPSP